MRTSESDRQRFVELVDRHQGILHRICAVYATRAEDRQDLFQDMVLQLWRSYGSFRGRSDFATWMYRVGLNTALMRQRNAARQPALKPVGPNTIDEMAADAQPPDEEVQFLRTCIRELPTLDRAIVLLYLEERSYEEISHITGLSRSNVSVRIVRLKARLRHALEQKGLGKEVLE